MEHIGNIRTHDSHERPGTAQMVSQAAQRGSSHHHVADPVWKEDSHSHRRIRYDIWPRVRPCCSCHRRACFMNE